MMAIQAAVDLQALGLTLSVITSGTVDEEWGWTHQRLQRIRTFRDLKNPNAKLPTTRFADHPAQHGVPTKESSNMWVVAFWQTWNKGALLHVTEKRKINRTSQGQSHRGGRTTLYALQLRHRR